MAVFGQRKPGAKQGRFGDIEIKNFYVPEFSLGLKGVKGAQAGKGRPARMTPAQQIKPPQKPRSGVFGTWRLRRKSRRESSNKQAA